MNNHPKDKNKNIFLLGILCLSIFFMVTQVNAERVGKIMYKGNAIDFNDSIMTLPFDMVALSEQIYIGTPDSLSIKVDTPSLFFVIDHSGSMFNYQYDSATNVLTIPKDPLGHRFKVVRALIDTLSDPVRFPGVEIGLAVFANTLYYDVEADPTVLVEVPGGGSFEKGGYVRLLKLNQQYTVASGTKTGAEILKEKLQTKTVKAKFTEKPDTVINYEYETLIAPPTFFAGQGTNITMGFRGVKHGILESTFPPENHYTTFFSDGENSFGNPNDYIEGVGVPTTFTVFFTDNGQAPQNLITMNDNIKKNGYSKSNRKSRLWPYENTSFDKLLKFLMSNVISIFQQDIKILPLNIEINGVTGGVKWDGKKFIFPEVIPLTGKVTKFDYDIKFNMKFDTINDEGDTIPVEVEESVLYKFKAEIDHSMKKPPKKFKAKYWERDLKLYHNNKNIEVINDEEMEELEIKFAFDPGDAKYKYTKAKVEVRNSRGKKKDKEIFKLKKESSKNVFSFKFRRSTKPKKIDPGDGVLQHYESDTLIAVFRNGEEPKLPLDTFQLVIPIRIPGTVSLYNGIYFDNNADGYVDSLFIALSGEFVKGNMKAIMEAIKFPEYRKFKIGNYHYQSDGIEVDILDQKSDPRTNVTNEDVLLVKKELILPVDSIILYAGKADIIDSMAPVITTARFVDSLREDSRDELTVLFSENIEKIKKDQPFSFYSLKKDDLYKVKLKAFWQIRNMAKFEVKSFSGVTTIEKGDSIRINWKNKLNVYDEVGNNQDNKKNIRREIIIKFIPDPYDLIVKSTILNHEKTTFISNKIKNIPQLKSILKKTEVGGNNHKGIMVITMEPDNMDKVTEFDKLTGTISIFDPVGNPLLVDQEMGYDKEKTRLIYIWDGKNQAGRDVGAGSYIAILPATFYFKDIKEREYEKLKILPVQQKD